MIKSTSEKEKELFMRYKINIGKKPVISYLFPAIFLELYDQMIVKKISNLVFQQKELA